MSQEAEEDDLDELEELEDELLDQEDVVAPVTVKYTPEEIAKTAGSVQVLDEEDLEAFEYDDPHDVVTQVGGVYVRTEDGFGLRPNIGIRGANSERSKKITLMEDGILFGPAPYAAPAAYYFPLITRMTQVEVIKGPAAVLFGPQSVGGALNLITRPATPGTKGALDVAVGSFPSGKLHLWQSLGNYRSGLLLEGVHLYSGGFKEIDFSDQSTGFHRSEVMLKAFVTTDPQDEVFHRIELKTTYSRETSDETYLGLTDADFAQDPRRRYTASELDRMEWWRLAFSLTHKVEVGQNMDLTTTIYRHVLERAWRKFNGFAGRGGGAGPFEAPDVDVSDVLQDPTGRRQVYYDVLRGAQDSVDGIGEMLIGTNDREFLSQGIQTIARHRHTAKGWSNTLEFGARFHADQIERHHTEELFAMRSGKLERRNEVPLYTRLQNLDKARALALHLADQVSFWRLTLTPGARLEVIDTERQTPGNDAPTAENSTTILLPGMGAVAQLGGGLSVLAGAYRGFSPVAPGQGPGVEPEVSINYEAGARFLAPSRPDTRFEAIGFFNDYGSLIGDCTFSAGCAVQDLDTQSNLGTVQIWGVETLAEHAFDLPGVWSLPVRGTYTWTQSEFQTGFASENPQFAQVEPGDELPYVPEHQASLQLGLLHRLVRANVGLTYVSQMREEASQGEEGRRTDALVLLDALVGWTPSAASQIYLKADNLLGQNAIASRRPFGARPIRPLFVQLGFKYDWE